MNFLILIYINMQDKSINTVLIKLPSVPFVRYKEEQIIFKIEKFFWETSPLTKDNSLLKIDVEVILY
jgi:hypothetical protein